jgi:hypothetical protein
MENKEKPSIGQLIDEETEKRLDLMGSPNYEFPQRINKMDVTIIIICIVISMVLIGLCMTGVIA